MGISAKANRKRCIYIVYCACIIILFLFLLWKCKIGFANIDESFYLTIPYRLCRGDGLIIHEWHLSQLSGFLLFPIMRIYLGIVRSTEGILLNFRYIFTFLWTVSACFVFYRLKSISLLGAMVSSICYMLYTPFGIMALSYNSMGIMLMLISCIIVVTSLKCVRQQYCIAGILFAGAVLCCVNVK